LDEITKNLGDCSQRVPSWVVALMIEVCGCQVLFPTHEGPHPPAHVKMSPILKGFLYSRFEKVMKKITATGMKVLQTRGSKILKV